MTNPTALENILPTDDLVLQYTQNKRKNLIESLTIKGQPADRGDKMVLLAALDGMDKVALTKMRIKTDDKQSNVQAQSIAILGKLLTSVKPKAFEIFDDSIITPVLSEEISFPLLIEGEMAIGTQSNNFESFIKQFPDNSENNPV